MVLLYSLGFESLMEIIYFIVVRSEFLTLNCALKLPESLLEMQVPRCFH